ncbi:gamma-glutamyltransferase [Thalassotalea atypica]|uniref:gamma-glutamyltransferase n=1 Tax=Thalassotalea atypica TaxID=2054316 RepID=UPI002572EF9A|nr:gamma-glutamyltransferase [Thalassotalea atypica]
MFNNVSAVLVCSLVLFVSTASAGQNAAVAMPDRYSAIASSKVLKDGGNAIDAAIAAQFVLAVTLPEAGNIGGGGFMTIYKDGQANFLDYREVAPQKAHRDMYLDKNGHVIPNLSLYGILSAGVPGSVDGMWKAHKKYGTKSWQALIAPAIELAEQGHIVHPKMWDNIEWRIKTFDEQGIKVNFSKHFGHAKAGELFKQPALASTLKRISKFGRDGFYKGETAKLFSQFMEENGGIINETDLANYQAVWREPIVYNWRDHTVITAPPPSSGGIAILQWLTMFDLVKGEQKLAHNSTDYVHVLSEIGKRVFADRAEYLGDPDFVNVPVEPLLNIDYLKSRAKNISFDKISATNHIKPGLKESTDTTHFSIVDQWGNAVSNTTTINYTFGSGVVIDELGFLLNDEMDDFSAKAGVANVFGAVGGKANEIQPNKRMLSSMSPTIMLDNGNVKLVTGSPGGTTIISSVYQSILNAMEFDMDVKQSVNSARFHHQLWPKDQIEHYSGIDASVLKSLHDLGYNTIQGSFGDVQLIIRSGDKYHAASEAGELNRGMSITLE